MQPVARLIRDLAVAATLSVAISCASPSAPESAFITSGNSSVKQDRSFVVVTIAEPAIAVGDSTVATAELRTSSGVHSGRSTAAWSSEHPAIAPVDAGGVIRGIATGTTRVSATIQGRTASAAITVASSAVATQLALVAQPTQAVTGDVLPVAPRVELRAASGSLAPISGTAVTAEVASGAGVLSGTTTVTSVSGVATFSDLRIIGVGTTSLTFRSTGLTPATSQPITVVAGPPAQLSMEVQPPTSAASGAILTPHPAVALRDRYGNPVRQAGVLVSAAIASGGGTLGGTTAVITDGLGVATFTSLSISGSAGTRTLRFSSTGLVSAVSSAIDITVTTPPPTGSRIIFSSDWSTALGTSTAALLDAAQPMPWSLVGGLGLEVVPSTGLDFPSANVLRVNALMARSGFAALRRTGLPVLAIGEVRSYRWYIRVAGGIEDANIHPVQDGNAASDANWQFETLNTTGGPGRWTPQFKFGIANYPNNNFRGPALDVDRTYRFEIQITRTRSTAFNFHVRVYDAAGTLRYGDADFRNISPGVASLASQGTGQFWFVNVANTDGLNAGSNGVAPLSSDRVYSHQGAFAVCSGGWCGPYVAGERPR